jgi:hypothetical protein
MGSDLSGFFQQIPFGIIFMFCASGIGLIIAIVFIARARMEKSRKQAADGAMPAYNSPASSDDSDMPDLAMLTDTRTLDKKAPAPPPSTPRYVSEPGRYNVRLNDGRSVEAVQVMTILRDVVDGGLIVQMGDNAYVQFEEGDAKQRFMKLMRELSAVVKPGSKSDAETAAVEAAAPVETAPPPSPAPAAPPKPKPAAPAIPPAPKGVSLPGDLPKYSLDDRPIEPPKGGMFGRAPKPDKNAVPELNIAGSIETFLQHKLQFTPEYAGRSIHVHPAPGGGVAIEVDGEFYDAVSDVTDVEVREYLSTTIQEWQSRNQR